MDCYNQDTLIVGGGVAGLAALNALADRGISARLIEASTFPAHKVCGEFFSYGACQILKRWGLAPEVLMKKARFHLQSQAFTFDLPQVAGGSSHYIFDQKLADRATSLGAKIDQGVRVEKIEGQRVFLSTGEKVFAKRLIIGTGRVLSSKPKSMPYVGVKAHLTGVDVENTLKMYAFSGAYFGLLPIEKNQANLACLAKKELFSQFESADAFMSHILSSFEINQYRPVFDWMVVQAPEFGPHYPNSSGNLFFIGDAAGTIAPASGAGLSVALDSGCSVVDYVVANDPAGWKRAWKKKYTRQIFFAGQLHKAMMRPKLAVFALKTLATFPGLFNPVFHLTRPKVAIKT